jgi:hypothetical protein
VQAGEKPVLGWSSWSTFRHVATAATDEAEARAMVSSGLAAEGYSSINEDDGWYTCYPVSYTQPTPINGVETMNYGPGVDQWGMWTTSQLNTADTGAFPNDGSINYSPDIESGNSNLTSYQSADVRFNTAALWQPYGGAGKGYNDLDSVEVGNGQTPGNPTGITGVTSRTDGLSLDGRESVLALWSLASSPIILGSDLTTLNPTQNPVDDALLKNKRVLAVDQDSIDASRIVDTPSKQVFAKTERDGDVIVGLFNTSYGQSEKISTTAKAVGLSGHGSYQVQDLYGDDSDLCASGSVDTANPTPTSVQTPLCGAGTPVSFETAGTISANVPPEGVAFYKITPIHAASPATPSTSVNLTGLSTLTAGQATTATETFTNNGTQPARSVNLSLSAPSGWSSAATSRTTWPLVASGQTVHATFSVTAPTADTTGTVNAAASLTGSAGQLNRGAAGRAAGQNVSDPVRVVSAPVEINEVQTGTTTTPNQQFVELYNPGKAPANVGGWQLEYTSAAAGRSGTTITTLATLPAGTSIVPGGYYLIGGAGYAAAGTQPGNQSFTQTSATQLSKTGGGIAIADSTGFVVDSLGYGVNVNGGYAISAYQRASNAFVESCPAQSYGVVPTVTDTALTALFPLSSANTPSIPDGDSLVRLPDGANTGSNCNDFSVSSTPTPGREQRRRTRADDYRLERHHDRRPDGPGDQPVVLRLRQRRQRGVGADRTHLLDLGHVVVASRPVPDLLFWRG